MLDCNSIYWQTTTVYSKTDGRQLSDNFNAHKNFNAINKSELVERARPIHSFGRPISGEQFESSTTSHAQTHCNSLIWHGAVSMDSVVRAICGDHKRLGSVRLVSLTL